MSASFSTLPPKARADAVRPFTVAMPDEDVEHMKALVKLSRIASPSYENSLPDGSRDLGLRRDWIVEAKRVWETDFDWRTHEAHFNSFSHFEATVSAQVQSKPGVSEQFNIHFIGMFSSSPEATPLILLHGWPGSFLEFLPILSHVKTKYSTPAELPYHIIVPSLPGYGFSSLPPLDGDFGLADVAAIMDRLMVNVLGLPGYVAQAGDVGSRVSRILAAHHDGCLGALLNYSPVPPPPGWTDADEDKLSALEKRGLQRRDWFKARGSAYALEQATRPATLGFALSASPISVLAWIGEKFLDWTDPNSFPPSATLPDGTRYSEKLMREAILSASLYWLTNKAHTCFYSYRETYNPGGGPPAKEHASPVDGVRAPKKLGMTYFPLEIAPSPRAWVAATGNLVFWREHEDGGGHFAALERGEVLWNDLEDFVTVVKAAS